MEIAPSLYGFGDRPQGSHSGSRILHWREREENTVNHCGAWEGIVLPHRSNETYSCDKEELGNTSSSPHASVISIPELFIYALYFVIAFVLEVIYLAIT